MPGSDDELQHFDISDIGKGLSAAGKAIGDTFASLTGQKKNKSGKTVKRGDTKDSKLKVKAKGAKKGEKKRTGDYKGGKKDRKWKQHIYGERHRNEHGKWVYDTDGVKRDKNFENFAEIKRDKRGNETIKYHEFGPLEKVAGSLTTVLGLLNGDVLDNGKKFIGMVIEGINQTGAAIRQQGKERDETGLPKQDKQLSKEEDLHMVNPGYANMDGGSQSNCPLTSVAYEMRRRGYEVTARQTDAGFERGQLTSCFKDAEVWSIETPESSIMVDMKNMKYTNPDLVEAVTEQMSSEPEGSRGIAFCTWYPANSGGHVFNYEIEQGEPVIYDAQSGQKLPISEYGDHALTWDYYRTDNLELRTDEVKKVVK